MIDLFLDYLKTELEKKEIQYPSMNNPLLLIIIIAKHLAIYYASIFNFEGEYNYFWDYNVR